MCRHHLLRLAKVLGALSLPDEGVGEGGAGFSVSTAEEAVLEPKIVSNTESTTDVGFAAAVDADGVAAVTEVLDAGGRAVGVGAAEMLAFRFAASTAASTMGDDRVTAGVVDIIGAVTGAVVFVPAASVVATGAALCRLTGALGARGGFVAVEDATFDLVAGAEARVDDGMRVVEVSTPGGGRGNVAEEEEEVVVALQEAVAQARRPWLLSYVQHRRHFLGRRD